MERYLVLEDGTVFKGRGFGAAVSRGGELVFTTGMSGYQESITDPSYHGQIIIFTYPSIGNQGINRDDYESIRASCCGVVVKEYVDKPSNWRSIMTIDAYLKQENIPGICDIDTRKLVRTIRAKGAQKAWIVDDPRDRVIADEPAVAQVSAKSAYVTHGDGFHVTLLDLGTKHSILKELTRRNCKIHVMPHDSSAEDILATRPDGILLSNGPGDPQDLSAIVEEVRKLHGKCVLFGICLGHQVLALSCGATTYKMPYGHRGFNHAVKEIGSNKIMFTSQNHGYAVSEEGFSDLSLIVTHREINDNTVEGLKHRFYPMMSVQFHPDATPGPHDASGIFDDFIAMMESSKVKRHADQ